MTKAGRYLGWTPHAQQDDDPQTESSRSTLRSWTGTVKYTKKNPAADTNGIVTRQSSVVPSAERNDGVSF